MTDHDLPSSANDSGKELRAWWIVFYGSYISGIIWNG